MVGHFEFGSRENENSQEQWNKLSEYVNQGFHAFKMCSLSRSIYCRLTALGLQLTIIFMIN